MFNLPTKSMVFKKLASFIYNFIGARGRPRIKEASSHEVVESGFPDKVEGCLADSPAGLKGKGEGVDQGEVCCVCLSRLKEGEDMRVLPCMHEFHRLCIDRWFKVCRKTCPVCRFSMGDEEKFQKREALTEEMAIWFSSFHVAGF